MRRIFSPVITLAFVFSAVAAQEPSEDEQKLQGAWQLAELIVGGTKVPEKEIQGTRFIFEGNKLTIAPPINEVAVNATLWTLSIELGLPVLVEAEAVVDQRTFTFKLNPTQQPAAVDLTALDGEFKGTVSPGIYEIKGDTLRWCQSDDEKNKDRPKAFVSPEKSRIYIFTLKRVAK